MLESGLGLSPWDVLNQGVAKHTPLSFGAANVVVAVAVIATAAPLGARIGPGTVANAVLIGVFVDLLQRIDAIQQTAEAGLGTRWALLAFGILFVAAGSALYIGAALGAGPRDSLMLALVRRTGMRVGVVRAMLESCVTLVGFALGGTVGIGTLAFAFGIGPALEVTFWLLARSPLVRAQGARAARDAALAASARRAPLCAASAAPTERLDG
jgi:uncharacterized protein